MLLSMFDFVFDAVKSLTFEYAFLEKIAAQARGEITKKLGKTRVKFRGNFQAWYGALLGSIWGKTSHFPLTSTTLPAPKPLTSTTHFKNHKSLPDLRAHYFLKLCSKRAEF